MKKEHKQKIDPKNLMAVERATTSLIGTSISLIVLGFVVEKFELFLNIISLELEGRADHKMPQLEHIDFYNYMGIAIVGAGIVLALFTYRYYTRWIEHLERGELDTDKKIYFLLSLFVALVGFLLLASMVML